jgi:hypothetical protein
VTSAAIGVLATSDGLPVNEWRMARSKLLPQVWLAALSTLSNSLLAYAFAEGVALSIWRKACSGTTVNNNFFLRIFCSAALFYSSLPLLLRVHHRPASFPSFALYFHQALSG